MKKSVLMICIALITLSTSCREGSKKLLDAIDPLHDLQCPSDQVYNANIGSCDTEAVLAAWTCTRDELVTQTSNSQQTDKNTKAFSLLDELLTKGYKIDKCWETEKGMISVTVLKDNDDTTPAPPASANVIFQK